MINSFSKFLVEEERIVYFTFGRMNPPTIGHGKLLDKLAAAAGRNPYRVFLSQSNDEKENPLAYKDKVKYVRKMFPKHGRQIMINKKVITPFHALSALYDEGFRKVIMVAGSDRVKEYDLRLNKYNGKKGGHGFFNFDGGVKLVSAGQRDPDAKGAEGASGTKQRGHASNNDFTQFAQGLPKAMSNTDAKRLFNDVRKGMGLKEKREFKNHVQLESVSDIREAYIRDDLFELGEEVVINDKGIVGKIHHLGSNYLIVETKTEKLRCWLDQVSKLEEDNTKSMYKDYPDEGTPEAAKKWKDATPGQNESLWANIRARRASGKRKLKPGDKNYPKTLNIEDKERKKGSPQDSDIKDRPGTQPKAYHSGLSKAQKVSRDRQFKRQSKMDDDNPAAYKPAAGDKTAKTKPSKHTKKFKQMFGEKDSKVDIAKMKIDREKASDARKHDRMMDRARTADTKIKNRATA